MHFERRHFFIIFFFIWPNLFYKEMYKIKIFLPVLFAVKF